MRAPSPRARGEGRDEGASPLGAELRRRRQRCRLVRKLRIAERPPHPRRFAPRPLPAQRREVTCSPVLAMRLGIRACPRHGKKALPTFSPFKKKGGGRRSAHLGIRPRCSRTKACCGCGERHRFFPLPRGIETAAPSPYGAHRGHAPKVLPSNSARAALPGIAGCKREDPPRRQCSQHLADRQ